MKQFVKHPKSKITAGSIQGSNDSDKQSAVDALISNIDEFLDTYYKEGTTVSDDLKKKLLAARDALFWYDGEPVESSKKVNADTVKKKNGKWANRGDTGKEHGEFDTKKKADAQRKAMYATGYKG